MQKSQDEKECDATGVKKAGMARARRDQKR